MPRDKRDVRALHGHGRRPRGAARPEDDRVDARRLDTQLFDGTPDGRDVGVVAPETAPVLDDGVHRAGAQRLRGEGVELVHDGLLVRNGDVGSADILRPELRHSIPELVRRNVEQLIGPVHAQGAKGGVVHGRTVRVRNPAAEQEYLLRAQLPLRPYFCLSRSKSSSLVSKCVVPCLSVK